MRLYSWNQKYCQEPAVGRLASIAGVKILLQLFENKKYPNAHSGTDPSREIYSNILLEVAEKHYQRKNIKSLR